jgi:serine protease AprX
MANPDGRAPRETRSNALWGQGNRGGNGQRSNALWGKNGRGALLAALAALALTLPIAAAAGNGSGSGADKGVADGTWIYPGLLAQADQSPGQKVRVIIQSTKGAGDAEDAFKKSRDGGAALTHRLGLIGAVSAEIPAVRIKQLARIPNLTVTPDVNAKVTALPSTRQLWPAESGNAQLWPADARAYAGSMPTIAIVDSGIDASRPDFAGRIVGQVNLSSLPNNSPGDGRGHGTFVAGIAAGAAVGYAGAAPYARIVSLDVMDDNGMGSTSDVINACQWILDHKDQYNIRVANFSLHSGLPSNFTKDPLDRAVEKLWFGGVVVVAAAGNYGVNGQPTRVKYAPGNDPFVITVGAVDVGGSAWTSDDSAAPWSTFGYTYDGFWKPDVGAPGRYMVGPVPVSSALATQRADHVVAPGYMQLSGTSFAAPVVSGTAAQMLARHPSWTPDQVKGALIVTARTVPRGYPRAAGFGQITASRAARVESPPNPNRALENYLVSDPAGGSLPVFDAASWDLAVRSNASWDLASYDDASYSDASWDLASYDDASYSDASYADASYADASYEDAAEGDAASSPDAYELSADDVSAIAADPLLAPDDPSTLVGP